MSIDWEKKYKELEAQRQEELLAIYKRQSTEYREYIVYFKDGSEVTGEGDLGEFLCSLSEERGDQVFSAATRRVSEWEPAEVEGEPAIA